MTETVLRPRSATELVDGAFQLFKQHFAQFAIVSGIGMIPLLLLTPNLARYSGRPEDLVLNMTDAFSALLGMIATWVAYNLASAAIVAAAAQGYIDGQVDISAAIAKVTSRIPSILYAAFVRGILIGFGFLLLGVGAAYFYATYFAVPTTIIIEQLSGPAGLARSKALAEGHRWMAFKPLLLVLIIYIVAAAAVGALGNMIFGADNAVANTLLSSLIRIPVYPIIPITEMLVYYDLRIRKEGLDLEMMASKLENAGAAGSPAT